MSDVPAKRYTPFVVKSPRRFNHQPVGLLHVGSSSPNIMEILPNDDVCFAGSKLPFQIPKVLQIRRAFLFLLLKLAEQKCPSDKGCVITNGIYLTSKQQP